MRVFTKRLSLAMLLIAMSVVTSLSCDKEKSEDGGVTMPQTQSIKCSVGERPTLSFTVNGSWQLSSDATWCKFISQSGDVLDISGNAGSHTITLRITDDNLADSATIANLTMKMGSQTAVIAVVERSAREAKISLYDENGKPIQAIPVGFDDYATFYVEANFRFAATEFPYWVEFMSGSVAGAANERVTAKARIIPDGNIERYPIDIERGFTATFADETGEKSFTFPVIYEGIGDDKLMFTGPTEKPFGWEVSLDGKIFRQKNEANDTHVEFPDKLTFNIVAHNDDYEIICMEQVVECGLPSYDINAMWMNFDKETMTLTVNPTTKSRYGSVMALPRGIYNQICDDIKANIFEFDYTTGISLETVKYEYLKYVIVEFTQRDFTERGAYEGMYVYHSLTTCEIPCESYHDTAVIAEYGVEEAFTCPFPKPVEGKHPNIIIDPRIEGWNTDSVTAGAASVEFYYKGERLLQSRGEFELGENKNEVMAAQLVGPAEEFSEEVYVVFKVGDSAKKLLVVTPPAI